MQPPNLLRRALATATRAFAPGGAAAAGPPLPAGPCTVFSAPHYVVEYRPAGPVPATQIAITFTESGWRRLGGAGFGDAFLQAAGFDVLAFTCDVDRWYQDLPEAALAEAAAFLDAQMPPGTRRVTYGSSMGGYAALMFAKNLRADLALAISPQFDAAAPWDRRWVAFITTPMRTFEAATVAPDCRYVLVSDPHDDDAMHVERYRALIPPGQFRQVDVNYCGHPAGPPLLQAGLLKPLMTGLIMGDEAAMTQRELSRALRATPSYAFNMAVRCLAANHLGWARHFITAALAQRPMDPEYHIKAALIDGRLNLPDSAIAHAATAVALRPDHPHMVAALAYMLDKRNHVAAAIHYFGQAIDLLPGTAAWIGKREELRRRMPAA